MQKYPGNGKRVSCFAPPPAGEDIWEELIASKPRYSKSQVYKNMGRQPMMISVCFFFSSTIMMHPMITPRYDDMFLQSKQVLSQFP